MEATKEVSKLKIKHNQETSRKLPKKASHINLAVTLQNFDYEGEPKKTAYFETSV